MTNIKRKIRSIVAHTALRTTLEIFRPLMDQYTYDQRKDFLNCFFELIKKSDEIEKSKLGDNLLSYLKPMNWFRYRKEYGTNPPTFFVLNPTNACDKSCYGCYAGMLDRNKSLMPEIIRHMFYEARESGMHFLTISGGEPFFYPKITEIFEEFKDINFLVYTHGQFLAGGYPENFVKQKEILQGRSLVEKLAEIGNVTPAISQEGYEKETDERRGKGTYKKILKAREMMNEYGIIHGASLTATTLNFDIITDEKFYDKLIGEGCEFFWIFSYIPIGRNPSIELMLTPVQRLKLAEISRRIRKEKKKIVGDFREGAGDAQKGSCMVAGRGFFNIDGLGNITPCVFIPYAIDNINVLYKEFIIENNKSMVEKIIEEAKKFERGDRYMQRAYKRMIKTYEGLIKNWDSGLRIIPFILARGFFNEIRSRQDKLNCLHNKHSRIHGSCVCTILDHPEVMREAIKNWNAYSTDDAPSLTDNIKVIKTINDYALSNNEALVKEFRKMQLQRRNLESLL